MVAPMSLSPARLVTGIGSPVSIDSSIELLPSTTDAVDGHFLARAHTQQVADVDVGQAECPLRVPSALMRRAVFGARPSSDLIAADVCERALSSSNCPSSVSEMITAAASK